MTEFCLPSRAGAVLLAAAVALAACAGASGKWTKDGVGPEAMAADLGECELFGQAAGLSAVNQSNNTYTGVSVTTTTTPFGSFSVPTTAKTQLPGSSALSYMEQGDAFARCMESRGYKRTAAP